MKNKIYLYFFKEFFGFFAMILFALTIIVWTVQAVNFLDLVTEDGHAFSIYFAYSLLGISKSVTKLVPFTFFVSIFLTILKLEKDNELIVFWTSGINKISIVRVIFVISIFITVFQLLMASSISPYSLNIARSLIKESDMSLFTSLLKEKKFNDTVRSLTIFVDKKNQDGTVEKVFLRDDGDQKSSTTIAKKGYLKREGNKNILILYDGVIQKQKENGQINFINFDTTEINLSEYSTKTTTMYKLQEVSTLHLFHCFFYKQSEKNDFLWNYFIVKKNNPNIDKIKNDCGPYLLVDVASEINRRFGMPLYIPLLSLISCFLLSSRRESKKQNLRKSIYFAIGFAVLIFSEISVRYSGRIFSITVLYYSMPFIISTLFYFILVKLFKYENLRI